MKNHKTILRASEAERIRKALQEVIIDLEVNRAIAVSERWDDPGDWDEDTAYINKLDQKLETLNKAIDLVGGLEKEIVRKKVLDKTW